ncbi:hypothetical protein [Cylindrospermum sp. FACHB-282]|uniref:hypothetical protein n=1 Tax=Cylindrospermum sp. FACHB-282 TaxID=2692794 RepID=UPI00168A2BBC|nr:hypothetical protein [Cylindrospermum sp. FACHB-282]MBD2384426.1 hypothetical protein [Cylindrospermum sp. FACHB-282]
MAQNRFCSGSPPRLIERIPHINMLGRYHFSLPLAVMQGKMRSRDPDNPNEQDD